MFSNGWLNFFYAAHNETASTILNMTFSLTDPFTNVADRVVIQTSQNQRGQQRGYQQRAAKKREPWMLPRIKPG